MISRTDPVIPGYVSPFMGPFPEIVSMLLFNSQYSPFPNGFFWASIVIGATTQIIKKTIIVLFIFTHFLFVTFPTITSTTQQLCIREHCSAAETPRGFVVNLQFIWSKVLVTDCTFIETISIGCLS